MELLYKPDFDEARRRWRAYWAGEVLDRPLCAVKCLKDGAVSAPHPPSVQGMDGDYDTPVRMFDKWASTVYYGGEAVPEFMPNFGPDIFAAFVGADLEYSPDSEGTTWVVPFVQDWQTDADGIDTPGGIWWERMLEFVRRSREIGEGKFLTGVLDLHGNMDLLSAIRGPQYLCMDILDCPEQIDSAMIKARRAFPKVFNALYTESGQDKWGCMSWLPFYSEKKYAVLQCDFACMISPEQFRRFVMPALEEESTFLDHAVYHYDGPDALVHLDDVLSIKGIHAIQWVPGSGNPPVIEWMDLLKRIQKAGKGLYLSGSVEEVKYYHKNLRPEGVFYDVWTSSQAEADALLKWLTENT